MIGRSLDQKVPRNFIKKIQDPGKGKNCISSDCSAAEIDKTHFKKVPSWLSFYDLKLEVETTSETQMFLKKPLTVNKVKNNALNQYCRRGRRSGKFLGDKEIQI